MGYAVGYFESWNLESLQGVVDAAEQTCVTDHPGLQRRVPVRSARSRRAAWHFTRRLGRAAAESSSVPCGLIFNECPRDDWVIEAIGAGFNLVMLADPAAPPADYVARVAAITRAGPCPRRRRRGRAGRAAVRSDRRATARPRWKRHRSGGRGEFVAATGIDLLAVSVGNVHIRTSGEGGLDLGCSTRFTASVAGSPGLCTAGRASRPSRFEPRSGWEWPRSISARI